MAISDAQFSAWLASDVERIVLCEQDFAYESAGAPATGTIYLSDRPYATGPADSPPGIRYHSVIRQVPRLRRGLDRKTLGGRAELTVSDLELVNDGEIDWLLDIVLDGQEARFYLGAPGWARADFRLAFVAVAERVSAPSDSQIVVKLKDKRLLLDREVIGNTVGGSGPEANQFLPNLWGSVFNLEVRLYDSASAKYAVLSNYATGAQAQDVRVAGTSLTASPVTVEDGVSVLITADAGTETLTLTSHGLALNDVVTFQSRGFIGDAWTAFAPFAGLSAVQYWVINPTANTFQLATSKGGSAVNITGTTYLGSSGLGFSSGRMRRRRYYDDLAITGRVELSSSATGRVTVDCSNVTTYTLTPFAFLAYIIQTYGKVTAADIDTAGFTAADTSLDGKVATAYTNYLVPTRANLLDAVDDLSKASFGWVGQTRAGLITAGVMDVSGIASATATRTINAASLAAGRFITVENEPVSFGRATVEFSPNQTLQEDGLDSGVTEANRRRYAVRYLEQQRSAAASGTAYSTNPFLYHKTLVEADPVGLPQLSTFLGYSSGISLGMGDLATELVQDAAPHRQIITAPCRLDCYDAEIGEVVNLVFNRYGMSAGVKARVFGVTLDLTAQAVELELVRQKTPDITTSSHH